MDVTLPARHVSISLPVEEASGVAQARRFAMKLAQALEFSEADSGRAALVVTEAATNIVQHAGRGEILLRAIAHAFSSQAPACIEVLALDKGPGITDLEQAMTDGFTTKGGLGLGLGGSKRLVNEFELVSRVGEGTRVTVTRWT